VLQYPAASADCAAGASAGDQEPLPLEVVERRLGALAHPVRLRLVRTLTRSPHTTSELAFAWDLTAPEVSRHLAVLRHAGLLTTERRGRHVHYSVDLPALTALGTDLLAAMLR
jgi:DNA-binding transcriptional ArsR family regulator